MHTNPVKKDTLNFILQMRNCDSERQVIHITKFKVADYLPAILFAPILYNIIALF